MDGTTTAVLDLEPTHAEPTFSDAATVRRTPFYLKSDSQPLFAWLHQADAAMTVDHGVLICPPIGYEQLHSHRTLRHLADRIAEQHIPVLRFDWHGTGDSAGVDEDAGRVATWLTNLRDAVRWMREELGCRQISLVGLRLGATFAAQIASELEIENLVLWSPVTKGRAYVREMKAISLTAEAASRPEPAADGRIEAGGFVLTAETAANLSQIDLLLCQPKCRRLLLVSRDDLPDDSRLSSHLSGCGLDVEKVSVPGYVEMLAEPHHSQVPEAAIHEIAGWLTRQIVEDEQDGGDRLLSNSLLSDEASLGHDRRGVGQRESALFAHGSGAAMFRETAIRISGEPGLFGIVCEPERDDANGPVTNELPMVVLLNAGSSYRVGPGRLNVFLARQLAAAGFRTLRLDICGLGDSVVGDPTLENVTYPATAFRDVELVLSDLQRRFGARRIVLMGLCSGAYAAFQSAAQLANPVLVESVLINPLTFFWRDGMSLETSPTRQLVSIHYYLGAALEPSKWLRLFGGKSQIGIAGAIRIVLRRLGLLRLLRLRPVESCANSREDRLSSGPGHPQCEDLPGDLDRIVGRRRNLALFFAATDPGYSILTFHAQRKVRRLSRAGQLSLTFLPDADHTFSLRSAREALGHAIREHLIRRYR